MLLVQLLGHKVQFVLHCVVVAAVVVGGGGGGAWWWCMVVVHGVVAAVVDIEQAEHWDPTEPYPLLVQALSAASVAATVHSPALSALSLAASTPPSWPWVAPVLQ